MLEAIFAPPCVAIVGASPAPAKLGHRVLRNVVENSYGGRIVPIHPTAPSVLALPAYPSIAAVPAPIDRAVIVVPPQAVLPVVMKISSPDILHKSDSVASRSASPARPPRATPTS
jgi:acyl-CoA synthetase (NDP forming)